MTPSRVAWLSLLVAGFGLAAASEVRADDAAAHKTCKLAVITEIRKSSREGRIQFEGDGDLKKMSDTRSEVRGSGTVDESGSSKRFDYRCSYDEHTQKTSEVHVDMKGGGKNKDKTESSKSADTGGRTGSSAPSGGGHGAAQWKGNGAGWQGGGGRAADDDKDVGKDVDHGSDKKALARCQDAVRKKVRDQDEHADNISFRSAPKLTRDGDDTHFEGTVEYKDKTGKKRETGYTCSYDRNQGVARDAKLSS